MSWANKPKNGPCVSFLSALRSRLLLQRFPGLTQEKPMFRTSFMFNTYSEPIRYFANCGFDGIRIKRPTETHTHIDTPPDLKIRFRVKENGQNILKLCVPHPLVHTRADLSSPTISPPTIKYTQKILAL